MGSNQHTNSQATVYIVEQDADVRDSLQSLLSTLDVNIKVYAQAEDFLRESLITAPSCLITELHLSGMSGLELLQVLKSRHLQIPTIVITNESDVPTAVHTMRAGAVDFINKPFIDRLLLKRVRQVLEKSGQ